MNHTNRPLCVDLDGTLLKCDLSIDAIIYLINRNPKYLIKILFLFFKSKLELKFFLAKNYIPLVRALPINLAVKDYIDTQKNNGRKIILISGSPQSWVSQVAHDFPNFEEAIGSKEEIHLVGKMKAQFLVDRYGAKGFDYIGNSSQDIPVWKESEKKIRASFWVMTSTKFDLSLFYPTETKNNSISNSISIFFKMLRPHQWVKNLLIFVPLLASHAISVDKLMIDLLAFMTFCLCASSGYILNDILDIHHDRLHLKKKQRPIPSGNIPIGIALTTSCLLFLISIILAYQINYFFLIGLISYFLLSFLYSIKLKNILLLDTFVLAGLYTLRLFCGGIAVSVDQSSWLHLFSAFFFLALALLKRFIELKNFNGIDDSIVPGRSYHKQDLSTINTLGISSGFASVVIFSLYIYQESTRSLYNFPEMLWIVCFLILLWINRIWILADRNVIDHDPITFAIKDKISWWILSATLITLIMAKFL